ncbi:hypothetical protein TNCV_3959911 [Trichonephila clavipes]|nr:hypothetical protein TNCV_3959911 [Trichonephila clavipes]
MPSIGGYHPYGNWPTYSPDLNPIEHVPGQPIECFLTDPRRPIAVESHSTARMHFWTFSLPPKPSNLAPLTFSFPIHQSGYSVQSRSINARFKRSGIIILENKLISNGSRLRDDMRSKYRVCIPSACQSAIPNDMYVRTSAYADSTPYHPTSSSVL